MTLLLGIGVGLLLMSILWPTALVFFMISRKAKPPISTLGVVSLLSVILLTVVLLLIPRKSDINSGSAEVNQREPDLMSLFRPIILAINIFALLFGFVLIYNKLICKQITRPKLSELKIKTIDTSVK